MAINLNPGADATLVTAATRAGLATAPADYSKTFESVVRSYEKTMEAQAEMWKDIGKVVGVVGADMVANANEFLDYRIKGGGLNPESAKFLIEELDAIKQAQKDLGPLSGIFGSKETRQKRRELKIKQAELFAEIDMAAESINTGAEAVAAGLFDAELATNDGEMINAIIKSNLKDPFTEAGNQAVLSRDEKTDELIFSILDRNGNPVVSEATGEPMTMTIKEFNKSIATNVKDTKNITGTALNSANDQWAKMGNDSRDGVYDPQMKQMALNQLDNMLNTDTDLKRAMLAKFGYSNTSFHDDIKNPSSFSEDLYVTLVKTIGKTKDGQVKIEGVLEGIADTDDKEGLSQKEINDNYSILSANILGLKDPEASKAYFKEYTAKKLEEAFIYGHSKKPPTPKGKVVGGTEAGLRNNGWGGEWLDTQGDGDGGKRVSWQVKDSNRKSLLAFEDFGGVHYEYKYEDVGGGKMQWKAYDSGEFVKDLTMKNIAKIEGLLKPADKDWSIFNEKRVKEKEENKEVNTPSVPMGFTLASLQTNSLSSIRSNLQNTFDADFKENFEVRDVIELVYSPRVKGKIAKKVENKIKIISKDGTFSKIYDIGPNATQETAAQINIDFSDYLKPDPLNPNR